MARAEPRATGEIMKKILAGIIGIIAIMALVWGYYEGSKYEEIEPGVDDLSEMATKTLDVEGEVTVTKHLGETVEKKLEAKAEDSPEGLIAAIEDRGKDPHSRRIYFDALKERYPEEALAFAKVKADEFSSTNRDLHTRMSMAKRRGAADKEAEGDFAIGTLSVNLVIKTDLEQYQAPGLKFRRFIKTTVKNNWVSGTSGVVDQYCDDVDVAIGSDFTSKEDGRFLAICYDKLDLESLNKILHRHFSDWSPPAVELKVKILANQCQNYSRCNVDMFMQRLAEPNNEDDVHQLIIFNIIGWPWAHCIPFEDMMKKAEKTGNTRFIETLIKSEHKYREKQRNCFNQQ